MKIKYILLLSVTCYLGCLDLAFAKKDQPLQIDKPPQLMLPFEDLDLNADNSINKDEVLKVFASAYDVEMKRDGFAPKRISFGEPSKTEKLEVKYNFTKDDFVKLNSEKVFEKDADKDGLLSTSEYDLRREYNLSEEECKAVVAAGETQPKSFADLVNGMESGKSAKVAFCTKKYPTK